MSDTVEDGGKVTVRSRSAFAAAKMALTASTFTPGLGFGLSPEVSVLERRHVVVPPQPPSPGAAAAQLALTHDGGTGDGHRRDARRRAHPHVDVAKHLKTGIRRKVRLGVLEVRLVRRWRVIRRHAPRASSTSYTSWISPRAVG